LTIIFLTSCCWASSATSTSSVCSCSTASSKRVSVHYAEATERNPMTQPPPTQHLPLRLLRVLLQLQVK
jgi:hypothetical protein